MPYVEEKCVAGKVVEIKKYYSSRYRKKGIPRRKNKKPTSEEQKVINNRKAEEVLRRKINTNFKEGDYHLILNYRVEDRPKDKEEVKQQIAKYLRSLRREYKKQGIEMKYIHVVEVGSKGAMHHHLVINEIEPKILSSLWKYGRISINPLDESGQYKKLASYLIKYTEKVIGTEYEIHGKRWNSSKNLKEPKVTKRVVSSKTGYREDVKAQKGYYIEKESIQAGIDPWSGYPYLKYSMVKLE